MSILMLQVNKKLNSFDRPLKRSYEEIKAYKADEA